MSETLFIIVVIFYAIYLFALDERISELEYRNYKSNKNNYNLHNRKR